MLFKSHKGLLLLSGVICALAPMAVLAESTGAEQLGRLFTDSRQREKLDAVRQGTYREDVEKNASVSNVRVDGLMIRSDGKNVIWVNGQSTLDNKTVNGIKTYPQSANASTYKVPVKVDDNRIKIKPGQTWSESTGTVKDNY